VLSGVLNKYHKEKAVLAWMKNNADPDPAKGITFFGLMWAAAYLEKTPASLSMEEWIAFLSNVQSVARTFSRERSEMPASKVVIRGR